MVGDLANTLIVHPSVPRRSVKELVDGDARRIRASTLSRSPGVGTTPHLSGELFRLTIGVDMVHVPFPGAGPAIQSMVAGHTPIMFTTLPPATPQVKVGKLRALAVMAKTARAGAARVPTIEEAGIKDQEADTCGPCCSGRHAEGDRRPVYREIVSRSLKLPDVHAKFAAIGVESSA